MGSYQTQRKPGPMLAPNGVIYRTSDLYYAAFLRVACVPLVDVVREGERVFFVFENSPEIRQIKREYFNREAKVSAMDYADEIRAMKSLCHEM